VHDGRRLDPVLDPTDGIDRAIDAALGEALLRASRDGDREVVLACVSELRARRLARASGQPASVVDLDSERDRRH
jgi:hypothetical protein